MQAEKGLVGPDFLYQNPCHKENCVNVWPFWDQTAPRKPLAYDLALSGIRPQERLERLSQGKPTRSMEERRAHLERLNQPKERQPRDRSKDQDRDR